MLTKAGGGTLHAGLAGSTAVETLVNMDLSVYILVGTMKLVSRLILHPPWYYGFSVGVLGTCNLPKRLLVFFWFARAV